MSQFLVRIQLHGALPHPTGDLHGAMVKAGFQQHIFNKRTMRTEQLLPGEYFYACEGVTLEATRGSIEYALKAVPTTEPPPFYWVVEVAGEGARFWGVLPETDPPAVKVPWQ